MNDAMAGLGIKDLGQHLRDLDIGAEGCKTVLNAVAWAFNALTLTRSVGEWGWSDEMRGKGAKKFGESISEVRRQYNMRSSGGPDRSFPLQWALEIVSVA